MAKRKKSKKKSAAQRFFRSRFFMIYAVVTAVLIVGIFVGGGWLRKKLADYEANLPVYVAEDFFKTFEARDFDALYALDTNRDNIGAGDTAFYKETLGELSAGKSFDMKERYTTRTDLKTYRVSMDGQPFADFTLAPSGEKSPYGSDVWKVKDVTSFVSAEMYKPEEVIEPEIVETYPVTITAPADCEVRVNGKLMTVEHIAEEYTLCAADFLPKGMEQTKMRRYVFNSETRENEVSVVDAQGAAREVAHDEEFVFSSALPEDPELKDSYEEKVKEIAAKLTMFTSRDYKKGLMQGCCVKNSPASKLVNDFNQRITLVHRTADFGNWNITQYRRIADNCFTCHVSFDFTRHFYNDTSKTYPIAYTMCFGVSGKDVKLYNVDFN